MRMYVINPLTLTYATVPIFDRANKPLMRRVAITLSIVAIVMLFMTGSKMVARPIESTEPAINYKRVAAERTSDVVWLMRGEPNRLVWPDPHTGMYKMVVCKVYDTGFVVSRGERQ